MSETAARSVQWGPIIASMALGLTFLVSAGGALWGLSASIEQNRTTAATLTGLRDDVQKGLGKLETQIANLPDISARLPLVERQLRDSDVRDAAQDQRIDSLRQRVVEIGADVEGLKRASAVALPGPRR